MVRVFGLERGPLVQMLAFTPYAAGWTLVPLVVALALRRWRPASVAAVSALVLLGTVCPRVLPHQRAVTTGPVIRVLTANMLAGAADEAALMALIRDHRVDVLALQEFTPGTAAELERLGMPAVLPHGHGSAETGTTGSALYSRFPLTSVGIRRNDGGSARRTAGFTCPAPPASWWSRRIRWLRTQWRPSTAGG